MIYKISKSRRADFLTLLLLLFCYQNFTVLSFETFGLKIYHLFSAFLMFPLYSYKEKIIIPPYPVSVFFLLVVVLSFVNAFWTGISFLLLNYIFAFYSAIITENLGDDFSYNEWTSIIKRVVIFHYITIIIKDIFSIPIFISFMKSPYGHPQINSFIGGGANLEASYVAMFSIFFAGEKQFLFWQAFSISLSLLYASRTALVLNVCIIIWYAFINFKKINIKYLFGYIIALFMSLISAYHLGLTDYVISRFLRIGNEPGSIGRIKMWMYALSLIIKRPIAGYGIGNSIRALIEYTGISFSDKNFHNIYIQMFIDLGIIGGIFYLAIALYFLLYDFRNNFENPIYFMIALYFVGSVFQFRGADVIMYYFAAVYFQQKRLLKARI